LIIDCAIHPFLDNSELRRRLPQPYAGLALPEFENQRYIPPGGWYAPGLATSKGGDVEASARQLFDQWGVDAAVLLPHARGLIESATHASAVARAINEWLAETWIDAPAAQGRLLGSIRVSTTDANAAVTEIERWAGHPAFVQVVVPLASNAPYGRAQFFPIWECACRHGLPVAVLADGQLAMELPPTPVGYPSTFVELATLQPMLTAMHVTSLFAEGVFDRLPGLLFVFADGGFDQIRPILWRLRKDWRATRSELAARDDPMSYIQPHVRFVTGFADGPLDAQGLTAFTAIEHSDQLIMFGSHHPRWDVQSPQEAFAGCPDELRDLLLGRNAAQIYGRGLASTQPGRRAGGSDGR